MNFLIVFIGGGAGSVARFALSSLVARHAGGNFPWGTMAVNIIGAFCIGLIVEILALKTNASEQLRYLLVTGFLGGFTTFSAFSLENALMFQRGDYLMLGLYVATTIIGTFLAVFAGMYVLRNT